MKANNYITIQGWMITELGLKGNDLITYALIFGFSQDGDSKFTGSMKYLTSTLGCTKNTARGILKRLIESGLIEKIDLEINGVTFHHYKSTPAGGSEIDPGGQKLTRGGSKIDPGVGQKLTPIINNNNKEDNKQGFPEKKSETRQRLLDIFNEMKGGDKPCRYKMTAKTERQMNGLMKSGYSVEDFRRVVRIALNDEYHIENGLKYITPEFVTRPDIFERYLNAPIGKNQSASKAFKNVI